MKERKRLEKRKGYSSYDFNNMSEEEYNDIRQKVIASALGRLLLGIVGIVVAIFVMFSTEW